MCAFLDWLSTDVSWWHGWGATSLQAPPTAWDAYPRLLCQDMSWEEMQDLYCRLASKRPPGGVEEVGRCLQTNVPCFTSRAFLHAFVFLQ